MRRGITFIPRYKKMIFLANEKGAVPLGWSGAFCMFLRIMEEKKWYKLRLFDEKELTLRPVFKIKG